MSILALNYLDPKKSTKAKQIFDNAKKEYIERLVKKIKLELHDFFDVPELDEPMLRILTQRVIQPSISFEPREAGILIGHTEDVSAFAFNAKRSLLITASNLDGTIKIWDVSDINNPSMLSSIDVGKFVETPQLIFNPTGKTFIVTQKESDTRIRRWDISNSKEPKELLSIDVDYDTQINASFNHDGTKLVLGEGNGTSLWDMSNRESPSLILKFNANAGRDIIYGNVLISASDDSVVLWNLKNLTPISIISNRDSGIHVFDVHLNLSFDGKILIVDLQGRQKNRSLAIMQIWNISDPSQPTLVKSIHHHICIGFIPGHKKLISFSSSFGLTIWDISDIQALIETKNFQDLKLHSTFAFRENDNPFAFARRKEKGEVGLWELPVEVEAFGAFFEKITEYLVLRKLVIALFNMIKDPSQRTEENYNKFPDDIKEIIKKLFPPQSI